MLGLAYASTSLVGAVPLLESLNLSLFAICLGQTGGTLVRLLIGGALLILSSLSRQDVERDGPDVVLRHDSDRGNSAARHTRHLHPLLSPAALRGPRQSPEQKRYPTVSHCVARTYLCFDIRVLR